MNWDAIGAIAELGGAIGVILTLFYLAVQIKISSAADNANAYQSLMDSWHQATALLLEPGNRATFIKALTLDLPEGEDVNFRAGGYIQIEAPAHALKYTDFDIEEEYREDWDRFNLWQYESVVNEPIERAYSIP